MHGAVLLEEEDGWEEKGEEGFLGDSDILVEMLVWKGRVGVVYSACWRGGGDAG